MQYVTIMTCFFQDSVSMSQKETNIYLHMMSSRAFMAFRNQTQLAVICMLNINLTVTLLSVIKEASERFGDLAFLDSLVVTDQ